MKKSTRASSIVGTLAVLVVVSACGGSDSEPARGGSSNSSADATPASPAPTEAHNNADIEFAQMMAIHHESTMVMGDIAARKATSGEIRALGERISAAQAPETTAMYAWLQGWGAQRPADATMGGMDMGGTDQDGSMTELNAASGAEFDRRFLELTIAHHQTAITMAETELTTGQNLQATRLAQQIIGNQQAEIVELRQLLQGLS